MVPASLAASRQPCFKDSRSAGGVEEEGEIVVTKKITARVRNSHPRLYFHCSHEELFSRIASILTSILQTLSYGHGAVQILGTKGRLAVMVLRANWMRQE